ncbi:hypothetical protein HOY80DRAFT_1134598 [Tuber brumale]|nr:hypothetical protein HOY80DRAFT_1134598 [Tuber brumale]
MSRNPQEGMSTCSTPVGGSSSESAGAAPQTPIPSLSPSNTPLASELAGTSPSRLVYPISNCSSAFLGETPHRHFCRNLNHPELHGLTCGEEVGWLNLHKELAEANRIEEERRSRIAEFELRARNIGETGERSVAEKVAIWEGMWAAEQAGNEIQAGAPYFTTPHIC